MMHHILRNACIIVALASAGTVLAQDVNILRSGVVKVLATTVDGKKKIGTGFVVKLAPDAGYIVTASHVVEGDNNPGVEFYPRRNTVFEAEVLEIEGGDPRGIALLKVREGKNVPREGKELSFASVQEAQDGEDLTTIGAFPKAGDPGQW